MLTRISITVLLIAAVSLLTGCPPGGNGGPGSTPTPGTPGAPTPTPQPGATQGPLPGGWVREARLEAFDPAGEDLYGDAVATSGESAIIGSEFKNSLTGIADVFVRFRGEWRFHARLVGGAARFPEQGFGSAVAISPQQAFVGAEKYDPPGSFSIQRGAVYVFDSTGPGYEQRQVLTISDGQDGEYFGSSLALEPDQGRLVAGAWGRASFRGAAYVFATNGNAWTQEARLTASDAIQNSNFGVAVAIHGVHIVVGAPVQNRGTGAAYVYERDLNWTEVKKLTAPDGAQTDMFGGAVAIEGNIIVVSAPAKKRPGDDLLKAGIVYVFERRGGQWEHQQTIVPGDEDAGLFGSSVAIDGGIIAIGIPSKSRVLLYENQGGTWTRTGQVDPGNETFVIDSFGEGMSFRDGTLLVGARSADAANQRAAGAAFVFAKPDGGPNGDRGTPTLTPIATPTSPAGGTPTPPAGQTPTSAPTPIGTATPVTSVNVSEDSAVITFDFGGGIVLRFVKLAAGSFLMGSPSGQGFDDQRPQRTVHISAFAMGETEVTQAQWQAIMGTNPSNWRGDNRPVDQVSWNDAIAFCERLSTLSGRNVRLPTEAEWEFAARAGTTTSWSFGDNEADLVDYAWCAANGGGQTHDVAFKSPNPWGLYDVLGNVYEWCGDWYEMDYYVSRPDPDSDPQGPDFGGTRVIRGGSYNDGPIECRSAYRGGFLPVFPVSLNIGFRVAAAQ